MSGTTTTIDSSMPFDPYGTSFDASQLQTYSDFSPVSIFDTGDFGADLTSDSASPLSPLSPALSASSFGFPSTDAWTAWDSAELSPEPENLFGCQTYSCPPSNPSLSPAINLLDLAGPAPLDTQAPFFQSPQVMLATIPSQQQSPVSMTTALSTPPTPSTDASAKRYPSRSLKRKSTSGPSADEPAPKSAAVSAPTTTTSPSSTTRRPSAPKHASKETTTTTSPALGPKKTAHNMIEKRYRTNLNDKITQLRDAVPSLRLMAQRAKVAEGGSDLTEEGEDGVLMDASSLPLGAGVAKLNKATILSKATEYILQLERRNHGLETENSALRGRMEGLEMMLMGATAAHAAPVGVSGRGPVAGVWN